MPVAGTYDRGMWLPATGDDPGGGTGWGARVGTNFSRAADLGYNLLSPQYGIVMDGVTDCATALNSLIATISSNGGGNLIAPEGILVTKSTIHMKSNVRWIGMGKGASFLKAISPFTGSWLVDSDSGTGIQFAEIWDMCFDCNNLAGGVQLTSPTTQPGHNVITFSRIGASNGTWLLELGGSGTQMYECHAIRNDISNSAILGSAGSGGGILVSGTDAIIAHNNMGGISTEAIQCNGGGDQILGNHIVVNTAGAHVIKMTNGYTSMIQQNYFDYSGTNTHTVPTILVQPGSGKVVSGLKIENNQFYAQQIATDLQPSAIMLDQATGGGTIENPQIKNNTGRAKPSFRYKAIVEVSGTVSNWTVKDNEFFYCGQIISGSGPTLLGINSIYDGATFYTGRRRQARLALAYSASINVDASLGDIYVITITNATAFTINNPTNLADGMWLTFELFNNSGGAAGAVTWSTNYAWPGTAPTTAPANGKRRVYRGFYDNTLGKVVMMDLGTADI